MNTTKLPPDQHRNLYQITVVAGHLARTVLTGGIAQTDSFIYLMDDMLNKRDNRPSGEYRNGEMQHIRMASAARQTY